MCWVLEGRKIKKITGWKLNLFRSNLPLCCLAIEECLELSSYACLLLLVHAFSISLYCPWKTFPFALAVLLLTVIYWDLKTQDTRCIRNEPCLPHLLPVWEQLSLTPSAARRHVESYRNVFPCLRSTVNRLLNTMGVNAFTTFTPTFVGIGFFSKKFLC